MTTSDTLQMSDWPLSYAWAMFTVRPFASAPPCAAACDSIVSTDAPFLPCSRAGVPQPPAPPIPAAHAASGSSCCRCACAGCPSAAGSAAVPASCTVRPLKSSRAGGSSAVGLSPSPGSGSEPKTGMGPAVGPPRASGSARAPRATSLAGSEPRSRAADGACAGPGALRRGLAAPRAPTWAAAPGGAAWSTGEAPWATPPSGSAVGGGPGLLFGAPAVRMESLGALAGAASPSWRLASPAGAALLAAALRGAAAAAGDAGSPSGLPATRSVGPAPAGARSELPACSETLPSCGPPACAGGPMA